MRYVRSHALLLCLGSSTVFSAGCGQEEVRAREAGLTLPAVDVDALGEMAKAAQLGVYLTSGLMLADQSDVPAANGASYKASFTSGLIYPGTATLLSASTERYRDLQSNAVVPYPPPPGKAPYVYQTREEFDVVDLKKLVKTSAFTKDLRVSNDGAGLSHRATAAGSFDLQAANQNAKVRDLSSVWEYSWSGAKFATQLSYQFDVSYKPGPDLYTTSVKANLAGSVPGAWWDGIGYFRGVVGKDSAPLGNIAVDLWTARAWAFTPGGVQVVRLPGAPLTEASFSAGAAGPSLPPPTPGGAFAEISGQAPNFTLPDRNGNPISLSDPRFQGKIVLVNFCASWCGPCQQELPDLRRLQAAYGPQGLEVIAVGVYEPGANSFRLVDGFDLNFPLVAAGPDASGLNTAYGNVNAIPTTYLLDRNHAVVRSFVGAHTKELFEQLPLAMGLTASNTAPPPITHCFIGGQTFNPGPNPDNSCQTCAPDQGNLRWQFAPAGTSCDAQGGTCNHAGQCIPHGRFKATYRSMGGAVVTRYESFPLDYDWGIGSPDPKISADYFTAYLVGSFDFPGGDVEFKVTSDDGILLRVDGEVLIDAYFQQAPTKYQRVVNLQPGPHVVDIFYFESYGGAVLRASWGPPAPPCASCSEWASGSAAPPPWCPGSEALKDAVMDCICVSGCATECANFCQDKPGDADCGSCYWNKCFAPIDACFQDQQ